MSDFDAFMRRERRRERRAIGGAIAGWFVGIVAVLVATWTLGIPTVPAFLLGLLAGTLGPIAGWLVVDR